MRIVFAGTRDIAVPALRLLIGSGASEPPVVGVFTQPDRPAGRSKAPIAPPVKAIAEAAGIPFFQPETWREGSVVATLRELAPDVGVVASYAQLLPRRALRIPRMGWLNIHPSVLPRWRGPSPVAAAILAGDTVAGVTIIALVPAMDAGPIVDQVEVPIRPNDTAGSLTARLGDLGAERLVAVLEGWVAGRIESHAQDERAATYSHMLRREDGRLDWDLGAVELERHIRAFDPWPGSFTYWQGRRLALGGAQARAATAHALPGTVLGLDRTDEGAALLIAARDGVLAVRRLQLEGRRELTADMFARGQPDIIGGNLSS